MTRCIECTMPEDMHTKYPKNTCDNFTTGEENMEKEKPSQLKQLAEEIQKINRDNGWNIWEDEDIYPHVPAKLKELYDDLNEKINDHLLEDDNPPQDLIYLRDDIDKMGHRIMFKFPAIASLIASEVSEALEWFRQINKTGYVINGKIMSRDSINEWLGRKPDSEIDDLSGRDYWFEKLPRVTCPDDVVELIKEEMADVMIRILEWWGAYDDDPINKIQEKMNKNRTRGNRHGGKVV